ncbi:MAG: hypothetical protein COV44_01600 [Deltaproteobacteria bacterium CG11_big_fil_rev_8_21_14_0_20_45_16]|nr:MAG: hypothetical protein COV44_01600 [Deltaproteobacteria bacterium CG11_big_fil_rev_8_21_14_0_20_45_16]
MSGDVQKLNQNSFGFYVGLIHYPVINRRAELVTSSVTNLDIHDIARASRTFGVKGYFIIHPSEDQQALNRRIINHWGGDFAMRANPTRKDALNLVQLVYSIEEALTVIERQEAKPFIIGTSAKASAQTPEISISELKTKMKERPVVLLFGTAYGLAPEWTDRLDAFLPPIQGPSDFNHLSVRSAATIYLDRIFGR